MTESKHTPSIEAKIKQAVLNEAKVRAFMKRTYALARAGELPSAFQEAAVHLESLLAELSRNRCLLEALETENVRVHQRNQRMRDYAHEAYWCWQGDGEDHPESLTCPVLMSAEDLRSLLADRRLLEAGERLIQATRKADHVALKCVPAAEYNALVAAYQEAAKS